MNIRVTSKAVVLFVVLGAFMALLFVVSCGSSEKAAEDLGEPTYVGSKACAPCHETEYREWANSLHTGMFQDAVPERILGDFNNRTLSHSGWSFQMSLEEGKYLIREWQPSGKLTEYNINFLLGTKRIQHYLSLRPDGSILVLAPTWDVRAREWIHGSEIIRGVKHNPQGDLINVPVQVWNKHCWNCHTSQEEEGFDIQTGTYNTTFTEHAINCEMCHGPGSIHGQKLNRGRFERWISRVSGRNEREEMYLTNTGRFPVGEKMTDCLQCHARRIMIKKGFTPDKNYYDHYILKLVELTIPNPNEPPIWMERHRRFANECLVLWESQCYLQGGATCINCHDPHQVTISLDPRYEDTNVLCTQCHQEYTSEQRIAEHTHHAPKDKGSKCIECHMLLITNKTIKLLQNAEVRDHNISSIPIPENTIKHQQPNSCNNVCHVDKDIPWVIEWMDKWYPNRPKSDPVEDVIAVARRRDPAAIPRLIDMLEKPASTRLTRGKAIKFLGEFHSEDVTSALVRALSDKDDLIRAEAASALSENRSAAAVEPLKRALRDKVRTVRLNAIFSLIKMGFLNLEGADGDVFKAVKAEYVAFLNEFPTVYDIRVDLGTYQALHENYMGALEEYKRAVSLIPEAPLAHYFLGVTYAQLGMFDQSLESFNEVLKIEPNFRNTRQLVDQVKSLMD